MSRAVRISLAAIALAAICVATLTPATGGESSFEFWCIACGEFGGLDVVANIVLFVPLGLTLALVFGRRRPAMLIAIATTLAVELLQIRVVTGRDASLSDLLANTLGAWIGTELVVLWRTILRPRLRTARYLAVAWAGIVTIVLAGTSWALTPAFVPPWLYIQRVPPRVPYQPFSGQLLEFDVDGIVLRELYAKPDLNIDRRLQGDSWTATALVNTKYMLPTHSIIVRVAEENRVVVWLDQMGWNVTCLQKTRAAELRLRSPKAALVDGLRPTTPTDTLARLTCGRRPGALEARVTRGTTTKNYAMRLAPSLGWALLSPFNIAFDDRYRVVSALWLVGLLLPAGYWSSAARGRRPAAKDSKGADAAPGGPLGEIGWIAALAALAVGLAVAPRVFNVAMGAWWEWAAALGGFALGAVLHRVVTSSAAVEVIDSRTTRHDHAA